MVDLPVASQESGRLTVLDVLRGIAIALVLGNHAKFLHVDQTALWAWPLRVWERCGWSGVDLFFVLSGYLVSGLLFRDFQRHQRVDVLRFFIRRGFKIYPSFYLLILATIIAAIVLGRELSTKSLLLELAFVQNYGQGLWLHTWSLAVEEHFYILLGLAIWRLAGTTRKNPFRVIPAAFAIIAIAELVIRIGVDLLLPYANETHFYATHLRLDALMCGVFISYMKWFHGDALWSLVGGHRKLILGVSLALLAPTLVIPAGESSFMNTIGLTTTYLGYGGILLWTIDPAAQFPIRAQFLQDTFATIGFHSYSIYLWHLAALHVLNAIVHRAPWLPSQVVIACYFVSAPAVGVVLAHACELPMLRVRERLTA